MSRIRAALRSIVNGAIARVEPYAFVEAHAEALFWKYGEGVADDVRSIVIVGAWEGREITALLRRYPHATVVAFEPSAHAFATLERTYRANLRVTCINKAVAEADGIEEFHEGSLPGTGSLLAITNTQHNRGLVEISQQLVRTTALDSHLEMFGRHVNLLKIDAQGAEAAILKGAPRTLDRTSAVLIEVALQGSAYKAAALMDEINKRLWSVGFTLCGLGVDPVTKDGNALYVRLSAKGD